MIKWNEYTWYSKTLAAIFFIIILPAWTFYVGTKYEEVKEIQTNNREQIQVNIEKTFSSQSASQSEVTNIKQVDVPAEEVFDCEGSSTSEMAQCAYRDLKIQDDILSSNYKKIIKSLDVEIQKNDDDSPVYKTIKENFIKSHNAWLTYRESFCSAQTGIDAFNKNGASITGTIARIEYPMCKTELTEIYIKNLKQNMNSWL